MRITWWGHSTCTVTLGGVRVLTDPVLTARMAHLHRPVAPVPPEHAAAADVVVVSHLHPDHLHLPSLRRLGPDIRLVVPRGAHDLLRRRLPAVTERLDEIEPGQTVHAGAVSITATPAEHDGRRTPMSPHRGPALGFVLRAGAHSVWFAGDTGLFDTMADIGPVDVAIVPVGGWGPTLGRQHLNPTQAAETVRRVSAGHGIPIHYGTFWPYGLRTLAPAQFRHKCLEPGRDFAAALAPPARAHVLAAGASVEYDGSDNA